MEHPVIEPGAQIQPLGSCVVRAIQVGQRRVWIERHRSYGLVGDERERPLVVEHLPALAGFRAVGERRLDVNGDAHLAPLTHHHARHVSVLNLLGLHPLDGDINGLGAREPLREKFFQIAPGDVFSNLDKIFGRDFFIPIAPIVFLKNLIERLWAY